MLIFDLNNEPWNVVFNSILASKGLTYSGDTEKGLIEVFPDIPSEEIVLKNEIFNIYYETPSKIKTQIESLFAGTGEGEANLILNVDDENKTIIAQGTDKQLDEIEIILNKIDVKKPQILIEAFLVEVKPTFETKLGSRIGLSKISDGQGGATTTQLSGIIGGTDGVALGTAGNSVSSFLVDGTSGLGIIRNVGSRQLKVEIDALEKDGDSRTISLGTSVFLAFLPAQADRNNRQINVKIFIFKIVFIEQSPLLFVYYFQLKILYLWLFFL